MQSSASWLILLFPFLDPDLDLDRRRDPELILTEETDNRPNDLCRLSLVLDSRIVTME